MTKLFTKAKVTLLLYKMVILRFVLFTVATLCTSILGALSGTDWDALNGQAKFMICTSILATWSGTMVAFFDRTISKLSPEGDPLANNDAPHPVP